MKIVYNIYVPSELSAGLRSVSDTVTVIVESGMPGGSKGEFQEHIKKSLEEWYDGGAVIEVK